MRRYGPGPRRGLRCVVKHRRGAVGMLAMLFMPVLLAALAATAGLSQMLLLRYRVTQAADLAALAAIQSLDRDQLAAGHLVLLADLATSVAREYVAANLGGGASALTDLAIEVDCHDEREVGVDRVTGRHLEYTTVCVVIRCNTQIGFGPFNITVAVRGHADASAVPR